jgi:hypothetical protein
MDAKKVNKDFDFLFGKCKMSKTEILNQANFLYKYYGGFDEDFEGLCVLSKSEFRMMLELYYLNKKNKEKNATGEVIDVKVKEESIFKTFQKNDSEFTYAQYLKEKIVNENKCKKDKIDDLEDMINLAIMIGDKTWRNELMTKVYNLSKQ